ncbi:hypothetical protein FRC07_005046 [Ceratobasidium sp. 392]|nr:hypothetical protein FRC07_005046 [Ceratobasidium sp. 392]
MHCTGNITQPCLPSDFDRFNAPKSTSTINPKPHSPTARSSINVYKPTTSDVGDNQKGLLNKTNLRRTIHPEGSIIHHGDHVVSNGQLDQPLETLGKSLLDQAGLVGCATVFLIPEGPYVRYYLADHSTKTIMWVGGDNLPSAILAADPQRVPNMLCEEYWTHMENFPAPVPAAAEDLQQLKEVLVSLAVDSNTSDGSTSPFSSAQIQQFLAMLNAFSNGVETFQTYTIGGRSG